MAYYWYYGVYKSPKTGIYWWASTPYDGTKEHLEECIKKELKNQSITGYICYAESRKDAEQIIKNLSEK